MARDIGGGFVLVTDRTLGRMSRPEIEKLSFELERCLREIRGASTVDLETLDMQNRNRRMQKLTSARRVLRAHLMKRKGP